MSDPIRGFFGGCQTPARFAFGLTLIGVGETVITLLLTRGIGGIDSFGMGVAHFLAMTGWNLALILFFFHLPLFRELVDRQWIHSTLHALNNHMRHVSTLHALGEKTLWFLTQHLDALNGVIYLADEKNRLHLLTGIGTPPQQTLTPILEPGEGIPGQVALTRKSVRLRDLPFDPLRIRAELLESWPRDLMVIPLLHDDQLQGVLALGAADAFQERQILFLGKAEETIARTIAGVRANLAKQKLLEESHQKTEELAINQQVLRGTIQLLEQTSGFKSRFLANMSHELRSPLNSLLILAQLLEENKTGNLTPKQVEFAATIHAAGSDLLALIDEILDLARIEAGKIRIFKDPVKIADLALSLERLFTHVARQKKLDFEVELRPPLPNAIRTDRMRVEQILKNLITNAIKFTHAGRVRVVFSQFPDSPVDRIVMAVADTGVGIPRDQHAEVFEPFRQLDDGANRKYGGSGLGLAICKELSQLLGGRIELVSEVGKGSLFTLSLPLEGIEACPLPAPPPTRLEDKNHGIDGIPDDRRRLKPDDRAILLIGMDYHRIRALGEAARTLGLGVIVAGDQSAALFLANYLRPVGLILVGDLPGVATLPMVKRLRITTNRATLPVLYLHPTNTPPPPPDRDEAAIHTAPLLREGGAVSQECQHFLQAILNTPLPAPEERRPSERERPLSTHELSLSRTRADQEFAGRSVLLTDDDIRNVFALTSLLEEKGCKVIMAENGRSALQLLQQDQKPDMILMDILLSDMDGYALLGQIRRVPAWSDIPLLVLTAKAMQGERQRCLDAGASDYLSKPVDSQKLLSMMRLWLH
ncbi:MAG: response regulator [Magnetococcales bacterium]|nr:response regulator [Magnetococcales bacterium]